ncbi:MFS transporter [Amycolatopsis granulosa]|uniref:MFS transporter n=1 Tax=Amycolatopsis granulosa TaxID=185684 RepID=UPI001423B28B|nr:MFS transporter [Amycolatopsis granulosa]NIH87957.1 MFS family permease [Amycolatopsis granulosa]
MTTIFWRMWCAVGVDAFGDGQLTAAIPLLAVTLTADPRLVAVLSAVTYLPWLLLALPAGVLVDRCDRANLMWRAQTSRALLAAFAAALAALDGLSLPALAVLAFGLGAGEVLLSTAAQAHLPDVVGKPLLPRANGYLQAISTVGQQFAGPPLGALLVVVAATVPLTGGAVIFALSAAMLAMLPRTAPATGPRARVADGVRWLAGQKLLRTLAGLLAVNTFCGQLGNATLVLLATRVLHVSGGGYGLLLAGAALGSVLGGLLNARLAATLGALRALCTALSANVLIFAGIGLSPNALVLAVLLGANGFVTTLWNITTVGLRQHLVPPELLGRVTSLYKMLGWGLMPVGALAGGFVAHLAGLRAPFPVAGAVRGVALLVALPALRGALRVR